MENHSPTNQGSSETTARSRVREDVRRLILSGEFKPGTRLNGPLILEERESTLVVPVASNVTVLPDYTVCVDLKEY